MEPTPLITPVILSGGGGTRLWPLSVPAKPKQLLALAGERTMLQETALRVGAWVRQLLTRAHPNVVVVALAAKLARIAWAVLRHGRDYEHEVAMA
jgi:mannose-1-phosphate guanylyltransferase